MESNPPSLVTISAAAFANHNAPPRQWLVSDLIPTRTVTTLMGDGGVGKGLLAAQLGAAVATGTDWIGLTPAIAGASLHVSAEDDADEMHRRLALIVAGSAGALMMADLCDVHVAPLAGRDAVLASTDSKGTITPTKLWAALRDRLRALRPRLLILENLADVFAGNELNRAEARAFVGLLTQAAVEFDLAVLLIGHPSLNGMATGAGTSGSTAWSNSVRSRLYLERVRDKDGEVDPDLRRLKLQKANYAAVGGEVLIRYVQGRFVAHGVPRIGKFNHLLVEKEAEDAFLQMLAALKAQGREPSPKYSALYAPAVMVKQPGCAIGKKALEGAMNRLLQGGRLRIEPYGAPSRGTTRFVVVA